LGGKIFGQHFFFDSASWLPATKPFKLDFKVAHITISMQSLLEAMAGNSFCPMLLGTIPVLRMLPAERVATMWSGAAASKQLLVQVRRRDDFCKRHSAGASVQLAVPVYGKDVLSVSSSLHLSKTPGRHEQVWQEWQK
jgi:hypothetical protein